MVRRRMIDNASCARCGATQESILHVLRDCSFTKEVWQQQVPAAELPKFFGLAMDQWSMDGLQGLHGFSNHTVTTLLFGVTY